MIIRHMRATFGRLEDSELSLRPGLNVVSGGNETGKSTWQAFLLAMLYGVDTSARASGDRLPDKTRFLPWNGKPMSGTLELTKDGRTIVLERTSRTGPLADFRAWDRASGSALEELTGKTCGKTLLGTESAVYTRSGFLRQRQAAVSPDALLEKQLSGLVTGGSEEYAYTELDEKLKKLQTSLRHNRTGALPQAEERRALLRQRLAEITEKQRELAALEAELHNLRQQRAETMEILSGLDALDQQTRQAQLAEAEAALAAASQERADWEESCGKFPPQETLAELEAEVRYLELELRDAALSRDWPPDPPEDPLFRGMDAEQVHDKVLADAKTVKEAQATEKPSKAKAMLWLLGTLPGIALCICGAVWTKLWLLLIGIFLILGGLGLWLRSCLRVFRVEDDYFTLQKQAEELLDAYGAEDSEGVMEYGIRYLRAMAHEEKYDVRELLAQKQDALLDQMIDVLPGCVSLDKANAFFREAAQARQALDRARLLEQEREEQCIRLRTALGVQTEQNVDPERFAGYDRDAEAQRLGSLDAALEAAASKAAMVEGAIGQMGDPLALNGELGELERDIARMEARYAALQLARTTLAQADEALRARFSPLLCQRTSQLFLQLTGGAYDQVQLDRNLRVTVRPTGSAVYRSLSYLSGGTVDQLYLALRLAICELLIPEAPIVLDDALVFFDDERAALALETLREMGKTRQIILFTSQSREKRILDELAAHGPHSPVGGGLRQVTSDNRQVTIDA